MNQKFSNFFNPNRAKENAETLGFSPEDHTSSSQATTNQPKTVSPALHNRKIIKVKKYGNLHSNIIRILLLEDSETDADLLIRYLKKENVEKAINLSMDKYCSVTHMLNKTATITHDFEIIH